MGLISAIEDKILAEAKDVMGNTVRLVETLPGGWTMETLKRALQFAPGVYVAFNGAVPGLDDGYLDGRFSVYTVSKGASEKDRRRGNPRVIGAYDMVEMLLPRLSVLSVADIGSAKVSGVDNLFRDAMFELGGTVYGINLTMPNMPFDYRADESALADFVLFHAEAYNEGGIEADEDPLIVGEQQLNQ
jgi:phage gp37-like protein